MGNNAISQLQEGAGPTQLLALQGLARTHSACASIAMSVIVSFHFKKRKRKNLHANTWAYATSCRHFNRIAGPSM